MFTRTLTQDYLIDTLKAQDTGTSTTVLDRGHSFGDDINLTGITDNVTPARTETYAYTSANRLQTAGGIWGSLAYGYDSVGNRTSEALTSGTTTTWTYAYPPTNNKLSTVTEGANIHTLTHDGAGNISADDRAGTVYNYGGFTAKARPYWVFQLAKNGAENVGRGSTGGERNWELTLSEFVCCQLAEGEDLGSNPFHFGPTLACVTKFSGAGPTLP